MRPSVWRNGSIFATGPTGVQSLVGMALPPARSARVRERRVETLRGYAVVRRVPHCAPLTYQDHLGRLMAHVELFGQTLGQWALSDDVHHVHWDLRMTGGELLHLDEGSAADPTARTMLVDDGQRFGEDALQIRLLGEVANCVVRHGASPISSPAATMLCKVRPRSVVSGPMSE